MPYPVVKTSPDEFDCFLSTHKEVATLWNVDTNEQFAEVSWPRPCTVGELMAEIERHSAGSDFIYVYNSCVDDPDEEWGRTDYEAIPEVKAKDLDDYIVRCAMGKDWLYFACRLEDGSSDGIITLLPAGFEDGNAEEDDLESSHDDW
jgi:hypothetical protein